VSHGDDGAVVNLADRARQRAERARLSQQEVTDKLVASLASTLLDTAVQQFDRHGQELDLGVLLAGFQLAIRSAVVVFMDGGMTLEQALVAIRLGTAKSELFEVK